jgi:hypothetical protein
MAKILDFRAYQHARSPSAAGSLKRKTEGSASFPMVPNASRNRTKYSAGILPRARQLLSAEALTPAKSDADPSPPTPSKTSSTEVSIPHQYSQPVKLSSLHGMGIVTNCESGTIYPMSRSISDVAKRLVATQRALGIQPAELCRRAKISQNQWSQFTDPKYKRRITILQAYKLKDAFGLTLEWIYDGDPSRLPLEVAQKLRLAA